MNEIPGIAAFEQEITRRAEEVQEGLRFFFHTWRTEQGTAISRLLESMSYSALGGGKRFRPVLALWTAEALGGSHTDTLPWALAVELIHTYSLIHDDLPCMDDDEERRGRPTNHVVYGVSTALLAGDALLTEAFGLLARAYQGAQPSCGQLVGLLAHGAGVAGMVGGQALDLAAEGATVDWEELQRIHRLKTGALIAIAAEGAAICAKVSAQQVAQARAFGEVLGLAFQIADDLLDADEDGQEGRSYVSHFGVEGARQELDRVTLEAQSLLRKFPKPHPWLQAMVEWNRQRKK